MMTRSIWLLFVLVGPIGCDDSGAPPPRDMAMIVSPDMASNGSCAAGLFCSQQCTAQNAQTCGFQCYMMVSTENQTYFQAVVDCIQSKCTSLGGDGGTSDCNDPQSSACATCVQTKCGAEVTACLNH